MATERAVLQTLAMEGLADEGTVTDGVDADPATVDDTLATLEEAGYVESDAGFWYLTDAGEERLTTLCQERFSEAERDQLRAALDEFEDLDGRMKDLASEWQSLDPDAEAEAATEAIDSLETLHADLEAWLDGLDDGLQETYRPYVTALRDALDALEDGERAYFTGTEVASYHDVWFDFHDDILRTVGQER